MSRFTIHRALASDWDMLRLLREEYLVRFEAILARMEPLEQWERLHHLAGDAEPVLLCWKRPPFTEANWCHRRMVAAWFEQELGVEVLEV